MSAPKVTNKKELPLNTMNFKPNLCELIREIETIIDEKKSILFLKNLKAVLAACGIAATTTSLLFAMNHPDKFICYCIGILASLVMFGGYRTCIRLEEYQNILLNTRLQKWGLDEKMPLAKIKSLLHGKKAELATEESEKLAIK